MTENRLIRTMIYDLQSCPKCKEGHRFTLAVQVASSSSPPQIIIGGGSRNEVMLTCRKTGDTFPWEIENPKGAEILGLADSSTVTAPPLQTGSQSGKTSEFSDWVKNSRSAAIDYCKSMLTTSTGAIAVFFALMKYLNFEKLNNSTLAYIGFIPPIIFLLTAIIFIYAMLPQYASITEEQFPEFRDSRLNRLYKFLMWGTILFILNTSFAIILFLIILS